jgi:2-polyprenyl-3-methyl-5-hydroxy-6-metoxy-1,4-benzoquinol methylase
MADQITGKLSPWLRNRRIDAALPFLRGLVLDFGCGTGELVKHWDRRNYVGLDIDGPSLEQAQRRFPGVSFHRGLNESLPLLRHQAPFDTVVGLAVVEHLPDIETVLSQLLSLLHRGGQLVLTSPHPAFEWIHTAGAKVGLFSREAHEEHDTLLNRVLMKQVAERVGARVVYYTRFLFGANQLFVLTPA